MTAYSVRAVDVRPGAVAAERGEPATASGSGVQSGPVTAAVGPDGATAAPAVPFAGSVTVAPVDSDVAAGAVAVASAAEAGAGAGSGVSCVAGVVVVVVAVVWLVEAAPSSPVGAWAVPAAGSSAGSSGVGALLGGVASAPVGGGSASGGGAGTVSVGEDSTTGYVATATSGSVGAGVGVPASAVSESATTAGSAAGASSAEAGAASATQAAADPRPRAAPVSSRRTHGRPPDGGRPPAVRSAWDMAGKLGTTASTAPRFRYRSAPTRRVAAP
ncbi:hypothetical protein ACFQX8_23805 [Klenkia terrae]|uniref:hypothetical protein n=1 Tax=Klenkia terrae TaxID=1052259 RepID=UPI00361E0629